jgi:tRNA (guanine37-N1)-methyltransferase
MTTPLNIKVFTLFPELFPGVLGASVTGRALEQGLWSLETVRLRDFAHGKHAQVDDTPCGGGAGMVMRPDVIHDALVAHYPKHPKTLIYLSPRGKRFTQEKAQELAQVKDIGFLCGRFEGVDQRVLDHWNFEELSLGDFVLSGGELACQAVIDATVRLIPGVLGDAESLAEESFTSGLLEYPQFTRPREWNDCIVPQVLLSGNHREIYAWRKMQAETLTKERRPDLWARYEESGLGQKAQQKPTKTKKIEEGSS